MSGTPVYMPAGPTLALSTVATAHAAVPVALFDNTVANYAACINTGTVAVAIKLSVAATAPVLPVDGTPGDWVLPPLMTLPIVIPLPNPVQGTACQVVTIGAAAGPSLVYVTPLVMQH